MNKFTLIIKKQLRKLPELLVVLAAVLLISFMPEAAAEGCAQGVQLCINTAIPALFPMMFATVLATETGVTQRLGRVLAPAARWLFGLSEEAGGAVVMALIGGFPAGAKAVSRLYTKGAVGREEAARMCLFCFAAGPAFLIGAVGMEYGSRSVGVALIIIQIMSVILTGLLSRLLVKSCRTEGETTQTAERQDVNISTAVTRSAAQTAAAMLNICLYIILFSVIRTLISSCGVSDCVTDLLIRCGVDGAAAEAVLPVLLEVTSGCEYAVSAGLPMTAFAVGFGGVAVHLQVLSIAEQIGVKYSTFFAARVTQGLLCALLMKLWLVLAPETSVAAWTEISHSAAVSTTPAGAVMLVVMSVMLLLCLPKAERN